MFSLSTIVLIIFAVCPALGDDIVYLAPGCDGPDYSLESHRGCVSIADTRLEVVSVATTTEHHRLGKHLILHFLSPYFSVIVLVYGANST